MSDASASVTKWVRQLQAGDKGLPVERLWQRYFKRLVELARANLGALARRTADEEDVALSAFDSFCHGALEGRFPRLDDRTNLWRLLVTITARKAYQLKLKASRLKRGGAMLLDEAALSSRAAGSTIGLDQFIATEPTPEFAAQAAEEYQRLFTRLGDDELRKVAQWKMEGFTNKEIAAKLGCAPSTVVRRLLYIRFLWSEAEGVAS